MKKVLFFLLVPIYVPAIVFLNTTMGWWEKLLD